MCDFYGLEYLLAPIGSIYTGRLEFELDFFLSFK